MARTRPVGSSGGSSRRGGGGSRGHRHKGRHPRVRHPRAKHPHAPKTDTRAPAPEPTSVVSAWPRATPTPGAIRPLMTLAPGAIGGTDLLALAGAQRGSLPATLAAWGRERDQALNRISRRPGGLAQLAGI